MRALLIIMVILLQLLLGWTFYKDYHTCCGLNKEGLTTEVAQPKMFPPLVFNWRSDIPQTNDGWPAIKDSILSMMADGRKLEITAMYSVEEASGILRDSLALRRAQAVRSLFPELADENFILLTDSMMHDTIYRNEPFEAIDFAIRTITENVKETANETVIYFPYNSTKELNAGDVKMYLDDVAERVLKSGEIIVLTGHTDNAGNEEFNLVLGRKRAETIQKYLIQKGVSESQIKVESKGESQPIGDNTTESGKEKNRRTVLKIIKP